MTTGKGLGSKSSSQRQARAQHPCSRLGDLGREQLSHCMDKTGRCTEQGDQDWPQSGGNISTEWLVVGGGPRVLPKAWERG